MMLRGRPLPVLTRASIQPVKAHTSARGIASTVRCNGIAKSAKSLPKSLSIKPLAVVAYRPFTTALQRHKDFSRHEYELQAEREKVEQHPELVSTTSSQHLATRELGDQGEEKEEDMMGEIKSDLRTIRETFALNEVPREAYLLGLAGLLPYAATSLTTVYLAWDINHADLTGQGLFLSGETATQILAFIEPLQIGYGAVIISFLGAIHWGLEWAGYGGNHGFRRYAYGVIAPAVAWPTTFMPLEYALISQFVAFISFYYADAQATINGWVPYWYSSYRFVLTFIVGASIVLSLIGRGEIADKLHRLPNPADRVQQLKSVQMEEMEKEERYRQEQLLEKEEDSDEESEEAEEDAEEE